MAEAATRPRPGRRGLREPGSTWQRPARGTRRTICIVEDQDRTGVKLPPVRRITYLLLHTPRSEQPSLITHSADMREAHDWKDMSGYPCRRDRMLI